MQIDKAGHHCFIRDVDDLRVCGPVRVLGRENALDVLPFHDDSSWVGIGLNRVKYASAAEYEYRLFCRNFRPDRDVAGIVTRGGLWPDKGTPILNSLLGLNSA